MIKLLYKKPAQFSSWLHWEINPYKLIPTFPQHFKTSKTGIIILDCQLSLHFWIIPGPDLGQKAIYSMQRAEDFKPGGPGFELEAVIH